MITIDKKYFSKKPEYSWLENKLDPSFKLIIGDVSKIIYGFNGIGKSSFTNCLKAYNDDNNYMFLDYESESQKYVGNFIKISPYIYEIEKTNNELATKDSEIDFAALSKKQGFTKTAGAKGPLFLKTFTKTIPTGNHSASIKVSDSQYKTFISKYSSIAPQSFLKLVQHLASVSTSKTELENFNKDKWREILSKVKEHIVDPNICPVCDSHNVDISNILDTKITALALCKSNLVKEMENIGISCDEKTIDLYLDLYNKLSADSDLLNDYIVCGNDDSKHKEVSATTSEINKKKAALALLKTKRDDKYNQIKAHEDRFIKDVARYLKIDETQINFDDINCEITIPLGRNARTYSTGERHILWFLVEIYSFLGSDCPVLVLDDPASSLDLVNLYKIAFEIIRNASVSNKTLLVFTHSSDLVNAINSQFPDKLSIFYLEEYKGNIFCDEILYKGKSIPNVIDTTHFSDKTPKIYLSLKERDYDGVSSPEHMVYHYSPNEHFSIVDSENLSNSKLCEMIESYTGITKVDFYTDSFQKVLLLLSLRVWLEKSLYNLIPSVESQRQYDFLSKDTLQQKLSIIENKSGCYPSNLLEINHINKENIASKKVMLNQNSHYYSQVMPFAYAINLSLDDVDNEIKEIKRIFGC